VRVEEALARYRGCIVLVTHDDRFAAAMTKRTLRLQEGKIL
jgi:ATPase subunit of ABC transporter with duplicated ATPase domains